MGEDRIIEGRILKGIGGFYYVYDKQKRVHECKARGRFRNENITPLPGDFVTFSPEKGESQGYIEEILPRKNQLVRPQVVNVDQVMIIVAVKDPKPDLLLIDKLIISAERVGILPILVINKSDLASEVDIESIMAQYTPSYEVLVTSAKKGEGLSEIKKRLRGNTTCFAGQSAVGKSSILNALFKELGLETGILSKKTARGKHTTRHAELIRPYRVNGMVVDTPGFSLLKNKGIEPATLSHYYPEMREYLGDCKFSSCLHTHEPKCAVKQAVAEGKINEARYERYKQLMETL
ncbi:MAG: ribosome small subunit-dependent GTPase A [Eubacteriales bacterium]